MKTLSHLNILVSRMPTKILQRLQISIMQEIRLCAELACKELIKVMGEKEETQQKYTTSLQEKIEVKEKVEKSLKEKNEVEEKA
jgi:hypothetical protein